MVRPITEDADWWHATAMRFYVLVDQLKRREFTQSANQALSIRNLYRNTK